MRDEKKMIRLLIIAILTWIWLPVWGIGLAAEHQLPYYEPSAACAQCHIDIHKMWANGMHAQAYDDPIFQASFLQAFFETKGKATAACLSCHDPTSHVPEEFEVQRDIVGNGVTCDFCHTIAEVNLDRPEGPFVKTSGRVKTGPYTTAQSPVHTTERREFFKKSELCGGCHQLRAKTGVLIIGTYEEWKESPYASEGVECQDCHMPVQKEKSIVSQGVKAPKRDVNLHNLAGGHSIEQVKMALKVKIKEVKREGSILRVGVEVTNVGSGHQTPTGTPSRKLLLKAIVRDKSGRLYLEDEKVFEKVLMDENKEILREDHDIFLKAARIYYDNRLSPKEVREVWYSFTIPYKDLLENYEQKLFIEAKAMYQYLPRVLAPHRMEIEVASDVKRPL
ncbi:MAG: ammonia-forming cytochrome c nitrite reductase subunit c552 [Thermodesulfobacteriota bacterium]